MGKYILQMSYVLLGLFLVFIFPKINLAIHSQANQHSKFSSAFTKNSFFSLAVLIAIAALILLPLHFVILCLVFSIGLGYISTQNSRVAPILQICSIFIGLVMASFLSSWIYDSHNRLNISLAQSLQVIALTSIGYLLLQGKEKPSRLQSFNSVICKILYCIAGIVICYLAISVGQNLKIDSFYQWHHWGAYISQAQLLSNGVIPFNDIPLLYGLGPISSIALGCSWNCWLAMFWITSLGPIVFTALIIYLSLRLSKITSPLGVLMVLCIAVSSCLLWPPYQQEMLSITTFPSISALRFLPALIVFSITLSLALNLKDSIPAYGPKTILTHICWISCFAWSPEAAIQSSVIWVPFYIWFRRPHSSVFSLLKSAAELFLIFSVGLGILCVIFYAFFGVLPDLTEYLTYLRFQQADYEKVNSNGMIWFAITCTLIFFSLSKSKEYLEISRNNALAIWLSALLCFANFSYFLSHSHDSVMADLLPYFSLLLFSIYGQVNHSIKKTLCAILLSAVVGWASLFTGWGQLLDQFKLVINQSPAHFFIDSPKALIDRFNLQTQDPFSVIPRSEMWSRKAKVVNGAIAYIHNHFGEPVETYDRWWLVDAGETFQPWNTMHGPVNFWRFPSERRRQYLSNGTKRLNQAGWLLYDKDLPNIESILADHDAIYLRANEIDFGEYKAIRYQPKQVTR